MTVNVVLAAGSTDVVETSSIIWTVMLVNTAVDQVQGAVAFPLVAGTVATARYLVEAGGPGATGFTVTPLNGWIGDAQVTIPGGGVVWYKVTDTLAGGTFGTVPAGVTFTPSSLVAGVPAESPTAGSASVSVAGIPIVSYLAGGGACDYCEPLQNRVISGSWEPLGPAGEAVIYAEVYSGNTELRNGRLAFWRYPTEAPLPGVSQEAYDQWNKPKPMAEIRIPWMPPSSTLTIDGRVEEMTLQCGRSLAPGAAYVFGASADTVFCWPLLTCVKTMAMFAIDAVNSDIVNSRFTLGIIERYRM